MKRIMFIPALAIFSVMAFVSCMKDTGPTCTNNTVEQDRHVIDSFNAAKGYASMMTYNAATTSSADYYSGVINPGTGTMPSGDAPVVFDVVTRLLNGQTLDSVRYPTSTSGSTIKYSELNAQNSVYYSSVLYNAFGTLREGGIYRMIYLSRNQAGCQGTVYGGRSVPANSQIITDYKLVDVQ